MNTTTVVLLVLAAFILGGLLAFFAYRSYREKRTRHIRSHFGPEYSRLAAERGEAAAEKELAERERRAAKFDIRPLPAEDRHRFESRWQDVQKQFVDDPQGSLARADDLLGEVMAARGYPVKDFDQRAADLSVDHPIVVQHYHAAHGIALRHKSGQTTTEDLRQAMIHYRALFEELVSEAPSHARAAE
ncbi:MAG TPA: hypothetical protein VH189_16470 [Rhizomicrobium sp.]|nr:hypothetical protein [Rhizomicrobium sp.]